MIRHLSPPPAGAWSFTAMAVAAAEYFTGHDVLGCNEVDDDGPKVAVYFPDGTEPTVEDLAAWDAEVAAWVEPPQAPVLDESMVAQATALAVAMLSDPDQFATLVAQVANSNTAKGPLTYVNAAIQAAAEATAG